jgi:hypothetical protein
MPKPTAVLHPQRQKLLGALIETQKSTTTVKVLVKDENGKEDVKSISTTRDILRWPLAQNVSEQSVEALAGRWVR